MDIECNISKKKKKDALTYAQNLPNLQINENFPSLPTFVEFILELREDFKQLVLPQTCFSKEKMIVKKKSQYFHLQAHFYSQSLLSKVF